MANRREGERDIIITTAAVIFAKHTRDAAAIGKILDVTTRTILRYGEEALWHETLDIIGYEGERNFRVRPRRKKGTQQKEGNNE